MNLRMRESPWRLMLAVNAAVLIGVFLYKITREPYVPYIHLLVDYHFGFTKRALIGAIVSLFFAKIPVWLVFALAGAVWLVTLILFAELFRRTFGFDDRHTPLFVFMAGSPFFLKNFMHTLGHFDIYGCAFALGLLLLPARSVAFVLLAALASAVLVLIHHIHVLMYVPTITVIVVLRYYLVQGFSRQNVLIGMASVAGIGVLFLAAQFWGTMTVPEAEFVRYLRSRMADPSRTELLSFSYIWYQPLSKEIHDTWAAHALEPVGHSGVRAADLAACAALAIFRGIDPIAVRSIAPPRRHRRPCRREPRLSGDLCDGVRLFAVDFKLGGLHVPDPACGEDLARRARRAAGASGRQKDLCSRLDRYGHPAGRDYKTFLIAQTRDRRTRT